MDGTKARACSTKDCSAGFSVFSHELIIINAIIVNAAGSLKILPEDNVRSFERVIPASEKQPRTRHFEFSRVHSDSSGVALLFPVNRKVTSDTMRSQANRIRMLFRAFILHPRTPPPEHTAFRHVNRRGHGPSQDFRSS